MALPPLSVREPNTPGLTTTMGCLLRRPCLRRLPLLQAPTPMALVPSSAPVLPMPGSTMIMGCLLLLLLLL
jgi:hypothetical protein